MTEVKDTKEIFEQESGDRPATPYFLVYVIDKSKEDLVDSVCRDVETPPEEQQDTVMEDCNQAQEVRTGDNSYEPITSSTGYATAETYNAQNWTHSDGFVGNSGWNQTEAQVYSNW